MIFYQNDPYEILDVAHNSSDEKIKESFYKKIQENNQNITEITAAYNLIKDEKTRNDYKWTSIFGQIEPFEESSTILSNEEKEKFIKEIAFLSDWILNI